MPPSILVGIRWVGACHRAQNPAHLEGRKCCGAAAAATAVAPQVLSEPNPELPLQLLACSLAATMLVIDVNRSTSTRQPKMPREQREQERRPESNEDRGMEHEQTEVATQIAVDKEQRRLATIEAAAESQRRGDPHLQGD